MVRHLRGTIYRLKPPQMCCSSVTAAPQTYGMLERCKVAEGGKMLE